MTSSSQSEEVKERGEGYVTFRPKGTIFKTRTRSPSQKAKHVVDLFCGVGGFSSGFEQLKQFEIVAGVDLLPDRLATFSANHAAANCYGQDIRTLSPNKLREENPQPFVVVGGAPCQGFSSIRPFRNVEWDDPRNNLAEEFCIAVQALEPEWIVFENVVGLLSHAGGKTFSAINDAFKALGYRTDARVLNAAFYGLPQRRERLIIVGSARGKRFRWPEPTHYLDCRSMVGNSDILHAPQPGLFKKDLLDAVTVNEALAGLPFLAASEQSNLYPETIKETTYSKYIRNGANYLTHHNATSHSEKMLKIIRMSGSNIRALPPGLVSSGFSTSYSRLAGDEPSVTLTVNFVHPSSNRCIHPSQDRALTPREGARIQGFFDTFEFIGQRAQVVKQIGNAVPPVLGRKIAEAIVECD